MPMDDLEEGRALGEQAGADELLASGREHVDAVFRRLERFDVAVRPGRALDVGWGASGLIEALAERFESVEGVEHDGDLRRFEDSSFDFVLSLSGRGRREPADVRRYLRELMRVLRPGGVAFFDVPETHLERAEVRADLEIAGGVVLELIPEDRGGATIVYVVARSAEAVDVERDSQELAASRQDAFSLAQQRTELLRFSLTSGRGRLGRPSLFIRRGLRRLMAQVLDRQTEFNQSLLAIAHDLSLRVTLARRLLDVQREAIARAEDRIAALERERVEARARNADLARQLAQAEVQLAALQPGRQQAEPRDPGTPA